MFVQRSLQSLIPGFSDRRAARDRRAAVRHQQLVLEALAQHQPMFELTRDGCVAAANDRFCALLGLTEEGVRGRPYAALLVEAEGKSQAARDFAGQIGRGEPAEARLRHAGANGATVMLDLIGIPVMADEGSVCMLVLARDVTAATRQEVLGRRAREALDNISVAVMTVDRDFVVTGVNRTTRELLMRNQDNFRKLWPGFDAQHIVGMNIDTFHRDPRHQRRMLADESKLPFRTDITVGDLKFALNVSASHDEAGVYDGNILEWMDVTELRTQQGQLAAIDRSQAVIEFSLDGRVLRANGNFLATLGYRLEEIVGQHHSMFVEPGQRGTAEYKAFWDKLGRGEYDAGVYKRIAKDGREVWIQASYNPVLDQGGRAFRVVKYATDVTAQIEASDALKRAVAETQEIVQAAQGNDLSQRIDMTGKSGEIGTLCGGLNGLLDTLSGVLATMAESCGTISVAAREIAMGNTDLSQRTEEQASSLEETSASLEELTSTVRQNADNAQQANKLAASASETATRGGTVVSEVVRTMDGITQSSRKISDIIGVIDEIAFQTNILALNAAVEAARAGDQGRGFAVVAAEVRSLAQRSANAAKEIKALISDSVEKVGNGSKLVAAAGQTMDEIVTSVKRVTDIMAEISAASQEQSGGLDQVNTAVAQMDKITQQNAALVEEAAAAAKSMEEQTDGLQQMVGSFVLAGADAAPPARPTRASAQPARATPPARSASTAPRPAVRRKDTAKPAGSDDDWKEF